MAASCASRESGSIPSCSGEQPSTTAHAAILYAFDLIELDSEVLRNLPFLDRKAALAQLLRHTKAGILLNEHIAEDGPTVFGHACRLGAEGIVSKKIDSAYLSKMLPRVYADRVNTRTEVSGPDGSPISLDIGGLLHTTLLTPENLMKLAEAEVAAWQVAISSVPKLLAPAKTGEGEEITNHP